MTRYFNGKIVELLAPAGTMETFRALVQSKCDAIYFGGKSLNMRMIRKGFNFSNEDIKEAIKMGHDAGKKVYITLNNMLNDYEIDEAIETLRFYNDINVDGLIVAGSGYFANL